MSLDSLNLDTRGVQSEGSFVKGLLQRLLMVGCFFLKLGGFLWKCLGNQCVKIVDVLSLEVDGMLLIQKGRHVTEHDFW